MASQLLKSLFSQKKSTDGIGKELGSMRLFALKESRWFKRDESNLFKNVLDSGCILELRIPSKHNGQNVNKDTTATLKYGIVLWMENSVTEKLKSFKVVGEKEQTAVVIHLDNASGKGKKTPQGIKFSTLESFWDNGTEIRINNMGDRSGTPYDASKIWERIDRASRGSYKWTNSDSFVRWCRYGYPVPAEESSKKRQMQNAAMAWGSVSASTAAILYLSKQQRRCSNTNRRS